MCFLSLSVGPSKYVQYIFLFFLGQFVLNVFKSSKSWALHTQACFCWITWYRSSDNDSIYLCFCLEKDKPESPLSKKIINHQSVKEALDLHCTVFAVTSGRLACSGVRNGEVVHAPYTWIAERRLKLMLSAHAACVQLNLARTCVRCESPASARQWTPLHHLKVCLC